MESTPWVMAETGRRLTTRNEDMDMRAASEAETGSAGPFWRRNWVALAVCGGRERGRCSGSRYLCTRARSGRRIRGLLRYGLPRTERGRSVCEVR